MNYLQPYKGKSTRHTCPSCKTKHSFTLYLNGNTHEAIHHTVGRCNREIKCGYHYTPKQYFIENPSSRTDAACHVSKTYPSSTLMPPPAGGLVGFIPFSYLIDSLSPHSNFVSFLKKNFSEEQIQKIFENYLLGATKNKEVIFWQIDIHGKVRTGKIMQYNPETGCRLKHQNGAIDWVHNKLKKSKKLPEDFNLQQCFFGEHLLKLYPEKTVAIVESEKTACIACCIFTDLIWLAAGNLNGLSLEKYQVLKERVVILYPDLGAIKKWNQKAIEIQKHFKCKISVSTSLEDVATNFDVKNGLDIIDFIFKFNNIQLDNNSNLIN